MKAEGQQLVDAPSKPLSSSEIVLLLITTTGHPICYSIVHTGLASSVAAQSPVQGSGRMGGRYGATPPGTDCVVHYKQC